MADAATAGGALSWTLVAVGLCAVWKLSDLAHTLVERQLIQLHVDETASHFGASFMRCAMLYMAFSSALATLGVETSMLSTLTTTFGIAIGLSFQNVLSNLAAGFLLLVLRPYKIGDWVAVSGEEGKVMEIELMVTRLESGDRRCILVPNGEVIGHKITNYSVTPWRRIDVNFTTPRGVSSPEPAAIRLGLLAGLFDVVAETKQYLTEDHSKKHQNYLFPHSHGADEHAPHQQLKGVVMSASGEMQPPPNANLLEIESFALKWQVQVFVVPEKFVETKHKVIAAIVKALQTLGVQHGSSVVLAATAPH